MKRPNLHKFFNYSCFAVLLVSCQFTNQTDQTTDYLSNNNRAIKICLEDQLADDIHFYELLRNSTAIRLETSDSITIGSISKIIHFENRFFILDSKVNRIHIFDNEGRFVRTIGEIGRGPNELIDIWDIDVDRNSKTIHLLSPSSQAVLIYDKHGNLQKRMKIGFQSFRLAVLGNGISAYFISYFHEESYNLRILKDHESIKNFFPFPTGMYPMYLYFTGGLKSTLEGTALYSDATSSKIYEIKKNLDVYLKYDIDLGKEKWLEEHRYDFTEFMNAISSFKTDFLGSRYLETKDILYFDYRDNNIYRDVFYNKNNKVLYAKGINLKVDEFSESISHPIGITESGMFISTINPVRILKIAENQNYLEKYFDNKQSPFSETKPTDNPILFLYEIKNFK